MHSAELGSQHDVRNTRANVDGRGDVAHLFQTLSTETKAKSLGYMYPVHGPHTNYTFVTHLALI
jgi:hypothetical protein